MRAERHWSGPSIWLVCLAQRRPARCRCRKDRCNEPGAWRVIGFRYNAGGQQGNEASLPVGTFFYLARKMPSSGAERLAPNRLQPSTRTRTPQRAVVKAVYNTERSTSTETAQLGTVLWLEKCVNAGYDELYRTVPYRTTRTLARSGGGVVVLCPASAGTGRDGMGWGGMG